MRRRVLASIGSEKLPYDYQVEWVASGDDNVPARFGSGVYVTKNTRLVGEFVAWGPVSPIQWGAYGFSNSGSSGRYVGSGRDGIYPQFRFLVLCPTEKWDGYTKFNVYRGGNVAFDVSYSKSTANGMNIVTSYNGRNATTPLYVGHRVRLKWFKVYESDTLIRDYIPVVKDGVGMVYDRVNDSFAMYDKETSVGQRV